MARSPQSNGLSSRSFQQHADPGERHADPGERRADPGERRADPGERRADPGERHADPGEQRTDPGERHADPGERRADPGGRRADPGERHADPGERHADPGGRRTDPGEQHADPGEQHTDKFGFLGGAQQYSAELTEDVPPEVLRHREAKWLDMLNHWDKWMAKKHKKVKLRCQKGVPPSLRGRAWLYLCGAKVKREQNRGKFQDLDSQPGDPKWVDIIERDLHRQFPFHEMFVARGGHGQQDLFRVLKAYTLLRPEEGYCQAQAPIAAVLLMHMPAEDAFWGLVQICEKYLPGYYSKGLEAIQLDGEILFSLLRKVSPVAHSHLKKHRLEPILYMTEWFMCAFSRTLPWASVLRVWDMFLCEGVKIIFRVGLVLLKCMLGTQEKLKDSQGLYETLQLLKNIQPAYMQEGFLVEEVVGSSVSERDIEREHVFQRRRWEESRGELRCRSPSRKHGARAIISAEPPGRHDLQQNPTILLEAGGGQATQGKGKKKKMKKTEKEKEKKENATTTAQTVLPSAPGDLSPFRRDNARQASNESLSSEEHNSYL